FAYGRFVEWEIQPLDHKLRMELAGRLLPALRRTLHADPQRAHRLSPAAFVATLEAHPQAVAWGQNPLLFSLTAAAYARIGAFPATRAALYQQVVHAMLTTREADPARQVELHAILTETALHLYRAHGRTFSRADVLAALPDTTDRAALVTRIVVSGVLEIVAYETYGFRHQTFQEYLAAEALARGFVSDAPTERQAVEDLAWSKRTCSRWTEILCLLVGVLTHELGEPGADAALRWLRRLAAQRETPDGDPGGLGLALVLKSLGEVGESEVWRAYGGSDLARE